VWWWWYNYWETLSSSAFCLYNTMWFKFTRNWASWHTYIFNYEMVTSFWFKFENDGCSKIKRLLCLYSTNSYLLGIRLVFSGMPWAVVEFEGKEEDVVPTSWLRDENKSCAWPGHLSLSGITSAVNRQLPPAHNWKYYNVARIFGIYGMWDTISIPRISNFQNFYRVWSVSFIDFRQSHQG